MSITLHESACHFALIVVRDPGVNIVNAAAAAQRRWTNLPGLRDAAIHLGFAGDELIEMLVSDDAVPIDAALAVYGARGGAATVLTSGHAHITPGPDQPSGSFALTIDETAPRPALLSIMQCRPERQADLFDYLMASAERFRCAFGGWAGAALFTADGGSAVFEYLQFESLDAMMALQGLPILEEHKANILVFGEMTGTVLIPSASRSVAATTDAESVPGCTG